MVQFTKMHGLGNDYIYLYHPALDKTQLSALAVQASDRHFGIGGDGLVCIFPSKQADFSMRMFNRDGSEAEMCGNAIRCVGKYVFDKGHTRKKKLTVETLAGIKNLELTVENGQVKRVKVNMGQPVLKTCQIPIASGSEFFICQPVEESGRMFSVTGVSMGNPHAILFTDLDEHAFWGDEGTKMVHEWGSKLEINPIFPSRTNVEFVKVVDRNNLLMRVWERGSGETFACGTGAAAAGVAAVLNHKADRKLNIKLLGGTLEVCWNEDDNHVYQTGPAEFVFEGNYEYKDK